MHLAIAAIVALLPIINPFSTAPMFLAITEGDSDAERQEQARKAVIYMVCILVAFLVGGTFIMQFFGLSLPGLRIAGGILVAGVGMRMLYPEDKGEQTTGTPRARTSRAARPKVSSGPGEIATSACPIRAASSARSVM